MKTFLLKTMGFLLPSALLNASAKSSLGTSEYLSAKSVIYEEISKL